MSDSGGFVLSLHASVAIADREIDPAWIEQALRSPDRVERDLADSTLLHALKAIPDRGGRVLCVVYNPTISPVSVVTVFFDRSQRRKR